MITYKIKNFNLRTIVNSGQCFRLYEPNENTFVILCDSKCLLINKLDDDTYSFSCNETLFNKFYRHYFDLDSNYDVYKRVCKKNDHFLKKCIDYSEGLKILNQDKFEIIISFIISQRKSVKAIQTSIERLCKLCGKKMQYNKYLYYSFPTAKDILKKSFAKLNSCGTGYRTEYIIEFCKDYILGKYDLESFSKLTDDELLQKLMEIKGVGLKVASCIALFAYHRISICPKDVWINRVLNKKYRGSIPKEYKKYAGIIQQYWFNYSRLNKI